MTEKTLILALEGAVSDSTMGLSGRGKSQINDIAQQMLADGITPDVIVHSPIRRSRETAEKFRDAFKAAVGKDIPLISEKNLSAQEARADVVNGFNNQYNKVMAVSGLEAMARITDQFSRSSPLKAAFHEAGRVKKAAASVLTMDAQTWSASTRATPQKTFNTTL